MNLRTRLVQLEKECRRLCPSRQTQMTDEELLASLRWFFQIGYLKFDGREVLSTIEHPDLPYYEECAGLARWLSERARNWPDRPLIFVTKGEATELLEMLEADELVLHPIRELDEIIRRFYLWPKPSCEHQEADQLARHLNTALNAWAEQTGQARPTTLEDIQEWVRALVSENEEQGGDMTLKARLQRLEGSIKPLGASPEVTRSGIIAKFRQVLGLRDDEPLPPPPEHVDPEAMRQLKVAINERLAQCRGEWRR